VTSHVLAQPSNVSQQLYVIYDAVTFQSSKYVRAFRGDVVAILSSYSGCCLLQQLSQYKPRHALAVVADNEPFLHNLYLSYMLKVHPGYVASFRGGFRHVQRVRPNRCPHKKGPHKRTDKFLQHNNIPEIIEIIIRKRFCVARWCHKVSSQTPVTPHLLFCVHVIMLCESLTKCR